MHSSCQCKEDTGLKQIAIRWYEIQANDYIFRFLLPRLHLDRLSCQTSVRDLRKALQTLPTKLHETYSEAMARIHGQIPEHSELALSAFRWILHAKRPLSVEELQCALAIRPGDRALDTDGLPEIALIVSVSAGLITVDAESQTIRLVHFTVDEYFKMTTHKYFHNADSLIAETCITYLSFDVFRIEYLASHRPDSRVCVDPDPYHYCSYTMESRYLFFNYASYYWADHLHGHAEHELEGLALSFLANDVHLVHTAEIVLGHLHHMGIGRPSVRPLPENIGIYLMIYFRLTHILSRYLERNVLPQSRSGSEPFFRTSPIALAAMMGHTEIVKLLIDSDDMLVGYIKGWFNPIHLAAEFGRETTLKCLLDQQPSQAGVWDYSGRTPLHYAIENGHEGIYSLLLEQYSVKEDTLDNMEGTPLHYAASSGRLDIAKGLLERYPVMADWPNRLGQTPLYEATHNGHESVVKLLLARDDVDVNYQTKWGSSLLMTASRGRTAIAELLLDCESIRPDEQNKNGRTPLSVAARYGNTDLARLLMKRDDVAINQRDRHGRTPLFTAVLHGFTAMVRLLLEHKDILPDLSDNRGHTPLFIASGTARVEDVFIDWEDGFEAMDLKIAIQNGHKEIARLLEEKLSEGEESSQSTGALVSTDQSDDSIKTID